MKKFIIFAAAALSLAACSNEVEENFDDTPVAARITAGVETRAINDKWEEDYIGVMVIDGNTKMQEAYKNVGYKTSAKNTETAIFEAYGDSIFFKGPEEAIFVAYGPWDSSTNDNELPGTDGVISGDTQYIQQERDGQQDIDYIYASGYTGSLDKPDVNFIFKHVMARLVINVKASTESGIAAKDLLDGYYTLSGLIHSGTFNVTTGVTKADENVQAIDDWELQGYSVASKGTNDITFTAILFPQTLSKDLVFKAQIDGRYYTATFKPELTSGKSYTCNITVKKAELSIAGATVSDWEDSDNSGEAVDAGLE